MAGFNPEAFKSGYLTLEVKKLIFCQLFQKYFAILFEVLPIFSKFYQFLSFQTDLPPNIQICCNIHVVPDPVSNFWIKPCPMGYHREYR